MLDRQLLQLQVGAVLQCGAAAAAGLKTQVARQLGDCQRSVDL